MPTGYTADIKDGISFEQFALNCAKAFGACISMRDLPSGAPIPEEFEPSKYHADQLAEARRQLAFYEAMPQEEATELAAAEHREAEANRLRRLQENRNTLEAYEGMLDQVRLWSPPSEQHEELKNFMIDQLGKSIEFDDSTKYLSTPTPLVSAADWLEAKKAKALKDIEYHKAEDAKEQARTAERNQWVRLLRESLR